MFLENYDIVQKIVTKLKALPELFTALAQKADSALTADDIANNLTTETAGKVLDASQGKVLKDLLTTVTGDVTFIENVTENSTLLMTKAGNTVCINGRIKVLATTSGVSATLFTIPEGFRPAYSVLINGYASSYNNAPNPTFTMNFKTDGDVKTNAGSSNLDADSYIYFDVSYNV